jgi:hypothetical protein
MFSLHHHYNTKLLLFGYNFDVHPYHLRIISSPRMPLSRGKTSILNPKLPVTIHIMLKNKWLVMFLRTFGRGSPPTCTMRTKFFCWLLLVDRLNTKFMLLQRNQLHDQENKCVLCQDEIDEDIDHLFFQCGL